MPDALLAALAQFLLFLLLVGLSGSVDAAVVKQRFHGKCGIILGLCCQFVILPFLGFCASKAFNLEPIFGVMLITVTSSPGGAYSNWWCSLFNADLALSIAMTSCSTFLSCALTPLNLYLYSYFAYSANLKIEWWSFLQPVLVAAAAIGCGLALSFLAPKARRPCGLVGNIAGVLLIVFNAAVSSRDDPIWDKDAKFYGAVALPCICSVVLAFCITKVSGRVSAPEAVAIAIETCYQNTGLALTIALSSFEPRDASRASGVPLFYSLVQVIVMPVFLLFAWKTGMTYAPANDSFHRVLFGCHQPVSKVEETQPDDGIGRSVSDAVIVVRIGNGSKDAKEPSQNDIENTDPWKGGSHPLAKQSPSPSEDGQKREPMENELT
ncbi:unnamed protein product [Effrenium voratum]|uniref:Uncharacterized protein n=1 Tax=Effrenium voratum TaxID=2562239 RepID=A0AA36HVQ5_9DINO|nr:unnamed protein product [Effrenium voratum]CAJ1376223.1 unnamed protein product [Effrenium voratum]